MEPDHLCSNLLKWLATFDAGAGVRKPSDISDGVVIAKVLHEIDPLWFDSAWLGKIKTDVGDNWRLKVSNLKKVTQGINDCFSDSLELNISHLTQPDATKLGEENSPREAGRLLQLVLGVAVNCSRKQEYIEAMRRLEPSVQAALMSAIQELLSRGDVDSLLDVDRRLVELAANMDLIKDERNKIQQRCYELDNQIVLLQDEKCVLLAENHQLQERLLQHKQPAAAAAPSDGAPEPRYDQLRKRLAAAVDENYKLEATLEELKMKDKQKEKELREVQSRNEELQRGADETRGLRDELDIERNKSSRLVEYETTIDIYKKRVEELGDLRRQIKQLEEKNTDYAQTILEQEEELKKSGGCRLQLELYKKQVGQLHEQLSEEVAKRDRADFDLRKLAEKMSALQSEKERLTAERDKLREANEELRLAQLQQSGAASPAGLPRLGGETRAGAGPEMELLDQIPMDARERLVRLQHENRQLRSQEEGYRALLDDLRARDATLQADNRQQQQQVRELQSRLAEAAAGGGSGQRPAAGAAASDRLYSLEQELQNKTMQIGAMEIRLAEQAARTQEQQELLARRDSEMATMEESYKKYLEKAKSVIRSLDPKTAGSGGGGQAASSPDVSVLRHQLAEKERLMSVMEKENERSKVIREAEERLISTALYNFGSQMHRQAMEQRLSDKSGAQTSFLSRQRQASARRMHGNSEFYDF